MKKYLLFFVAGGSVLFAFSQDDTVMIKKNIRVFADSFANAYSKKDWKIYTSLTIPAYIKKLGGEEGFIRYSKELLSEMPGAAVKEYKITGIMQLLKTPTNWQCVIQQKKVYEEDKLRLKNTSYLIGGINRRN